LPSRLHFVDVVQSGTKEIFHHLEDRFLDCLGDQFQLTDPTEILAHVQIRFPRDEASGFVNLRMPSGGVIVEPLEDEVHECAVVMQD
jgi:hypothetical protein